VDNIKVDLRETGWDKLSGSTKCWEVFEKLHNWWFLKKDSAP
jgi:hypothetical protein